MQRFHTLLQEHVCLEPMYGTMILPLEIMRKGLYKFHVDIESRRKEEAISSHML